ncbi:nucleoid-associated protein, YbaB/EbfC family [Candidatus Marinamargulisbacteria bacterium SCGC AAA071-K20]|nr:nucleoid-associated protein, YbaB/EbfC family [Candidatus Marinamargulisbacteria bacterium SCGC AAA071-K20]
MFEGLKDMGKLVKQAKEMKSKMKNVQDELKDVKVTGRSASGNVEVVLTGELVCLDIKIAPSLLEQGMADIMKKQLKEAFNSAAQDAKGIATSKLSDISKGFNIPGLT